MLSRAVCLLWIGLAWGVLAVAADGESSPVVINTSRLCLELMSRIRFRMAMRPYPPGTDGPLGPPGMLHLNDGRPFPLLRQDGARAIESEGRAKITPENIDQLFTHEYKPGLFGAKGLATNGTSLPLDNQNVVFFWKTGNGDKGIEFHHRDALATLKRLEAEEARRDQLKIEAQIDYLHTLLGENHLVGLLPAEVTEPLHDMMLRTLERRLEHAVAIENAAKQWLEDADRVNNERNQGSLRPRDLLEHCGFQMTAQRKNGKLKIVYLDVDSSITSAQLSLLRADPNWAKPGGPLTMEETLNNAIAAAHASIAPELRAYKTIRVKNLRELQAAGIRIKVPAGLRLEELP